MKCSNLSTLMLSVFLLSSCSSGPSGRYSQHEDSAPTRLPTESELRSAVPVHEPISPQGNRDYRVLGNNYEVMDSAVGYVEEGYASWYGNKFHGHLTSNGEYYDMYSMSAAHTRLPLPTYVKVTNLNNDRTVTVRVNDRGPFHPERIIDLSFAAAYKLGMLDSGTAPVRVEAINLKTPMRVEDQSAPGSQSNYHIQLVASSDINRLSQLKRNLPPKFQEIATTEKTDGLHKLMLGPVSEQKSYDLLEQIRSSGYPQAFRVKAAQSQTDTPDAVQQN
ncbi:septal ring lytic transglycosylase RlpA family protein [Idiomarina loihiensis]|uniref:Endolytic peptidoglycan transglycosylase RlpA n=1 Tax=Idiomarina loihiensis (strain ATCC BAA-735 / DSM 15497 / L2-TR) TaxID=283942 RepID=Q5QYD5_IDILO|nr:MULTISPECIES: septal ring lytic transglycosylase RlpA family protein [Idiomarina]AAV81796.1 Rare lipoprotein A [Idiomarina loihiensis L2TR]AGM35826.1 rare lipoprotein A [Idiomarina loihiensis GSL 199]MAA63084.1 septal ring lytic transglycosylase RlpA family lipoprotein [Idiomarina sp.]MBL4855542.1 septal ring lytic transglycosylase RlpA family protein [Idiomarina sp.]MRJ43582.1 septal ring lytic transglycosylase RlpA family protein [Idiomarina loihiensis]